MPIITILEKAYRVSNLLASLGHTGRRSIVIGHPLNTVWHVITKNPHNVLSKFTVLCWASFIAVLGCTQPVGHRLDSPRRVPTWPLITRGPCTLGFLASPETAQPPELKGSAARGCATWCRLIQNRGHFCTWASSCSNGCDWISHDPPSIAAHRQI